MLCSPRHAFLVCVLFNACVSSASAQGELVENGGFETGNFFPWWVPPSIPGQSLFFVDSGSSAHSGTRFANIASTSLQYIGQVLPTEAGEDYELTFWLRRPSAAANLFIVRWEGTPVFAQFFALPTANEWYQFTVPLHSNITGSFLEFGQQAFPGAWLLDDVSVVQVPAPSAAALLGMAGLVALRRRRR